MTNQKDSIEFWQAGEWTMVYLNGELQRAGDHYLADEWLQERFGVVVVDDQNSASCPDGHNACRTLAEAEENMRTWQERKAKAEELRKQADKLRDEAYWLEKGEEPEPATGRNVGHGHVNPRPDGVKARCGGPGICTECSREAAAKA